MLSQTQPSTSSSSSNHLSSSECGCLSQTDSPLLLPHTPPISPSTSTSPQKPPHPRPKLTIRTNFNGHPSPNDRPKLGTAPAPWERKVSQRQKQVEYGYNTIGYHNYITQIPRAQRKRGDPQTPDKNQICSTRSWMGQMKRWRRKLHQWDNFDQEGNVDGHSTMELNTSDSKSWDSYSSIDSEKASIAAAEWLDQVSDSEASSLPDEEVKPTKKLELGDEIYRFNSLSHYEQEHFGQP